MLVDVRGVLGSRPCALVPKRIRVSVANYFSHRSWTFDRHSFRSDFARGRRSFQNSTAGVRSDLGYVAANSKRFATVAHRFQSSSSVCPSYMCPTSATGSGQRLPDSLFGAVLIAGFVIMLLLDQLHTSIAKGKSFQTSPPPDTDNDPEDPWKVQIAKIATRHKHVWVSFVPA